MQRDEEKPIAANSQNSRRARPFYLDGFLDRALSRKKHCLENPGAITGNVCKLCVSSRRNPALQVGADDAESGIRVLAHASVGTVADMERQGEEPNRGR